MLLKTLLESANQRAYAQPRVFATEQVPAFRNFTAPYRTGFREGETVVSLGNFCGGIFRKKLGLLRCRHMVTLVLPHTQHATKRANQAAIAATLCS